MALFRKLALERWLTPDDDDSASDDDTCPRCGEADDNTLRNLALRNCELRRSASRGAHLVARRDLVPGDLVVASGAVVEAVTSPLHCDVCKRRGGAVLCQSCGVVSYCMPCRRRGGEALFDWHRRECPCLAALAVQWDSPTSDLSCRVLQRYRQRGYVMAVLRLAVHGRTTWRHAAEGAADPFFREMSASGILLSHCEHTERKAEQLQCARELAELVCGIGRRAVGDGGAGAEDLSGLLARVSREALVCEVNNHTIHDLVTQHAIGEGLYPSVAALNHSCNHSCDFLPDCDGRLRVVVVRPVCAGTELTVSYTDCLTQTTDERLASLRRDFFFHCSCMRCTERWDSFLDEAGGGDMAAVAAAHAKAEASREAESALAAYENALQAAAGLPKLHRLHYICASGVHVNAVACGNSSKARAALDAMIQWRDAVNSRLAVTATESGSGMAVLNLGRVGHELQRALAAVAEAKACSSQVPAGFRETCREGILRAASTLALWVGEMHPAVMGIRAWAQYADLGCDILTHRVLHRAFDDDATEGRGFDVAPWLSFFGLQQQQQQQQ